MVVVVFTTSARASTCRRAKVRGSTSEEKKLSKKTLVFTKINIYFFFDIFSATIKIIKSSFKNYFSDCRDVNDRLFKSGASDVFSIDVRSR
jgi:hypothetical protein